MSASTGTAQHSEDDWFAISLKATIVLDPRRALRFCATPFAHGATAISLRKPIQI